MPIPGFRLILRQNKKLTIMVHSGFVATATTVVIAIVTFFTSIILSK